jgi:hypothetical protein
VSTRLTWAQVRARRMERQALSDSPPLRAPVDIAGALCAVHAQVITAAELAIAVRATGATRDMIRDAVWSERSLIKTRGPRGTVHLLRTEDLPMWLGALGALPVGRSAHPDGVRMTPEQTEQVIDAIATALANDELTVDELTDAIVGFVGSWAGDPVIDAFQTKWPRWRQIEHMAANRGALCFGPNRGRNVTYTSPRRWLPRFEPAAGPSAVADLLRRYLYAHGPATSAQFANWLATSPRWAADVFEAHRERLAMVEVEGTQMWVAAGDDEELDEPARGVRLLPFFDAYSYSGRPKEMLYPGAAATRALGLNYQVMVVDGVVGGIWHQRRSGRRLAVTVEPFVRLTAARRRELDARVAHIAEFLEATPTVTIGTVCVGGHA